MKLHVNGLLDPGSKYSELIGTMSAFNCLYLGHYFKLELKFATNIYFKELFQNLRPRLKYSKNRILVTSCFSTLLKLTIWFFVIRRSGHVGVKECIVLE